MTIRRMQKMIAVASLIIAAHNSSTNSAVAQDEVGIRFDKSGVNVYSRSFEDYYRLPPERIVWLREQRVPEDNWPLLFELARVGNLEIDGIVKLRQRGMNWYDIFDHYHVSPTFLYLDAPAENLGPPFGKAYGYYRKHPHERVVWVDDDLVRLGTVKFLSATTHRPVVDIVRVYESSPRFTVHYDDKHRDKHHDKHNDARCGGGGGGDHARRSPSEHAQGGHGGSHGDSHGKHNGKGKGHGGGEGHGKGGGKGGHGKSK